MKAAFILQLKESIANISKYSLSILFYIMICFMFGYFKVSSGLENVYIIAILAATMPIPYLVRDDYKNGITYLLLSNNIKPWQIYIIKSICYIIVVIIPILLLTPISMAMLNIKVENLVLQSLSLISFLLPLSFIMVFNSFLMIEARKNTVMPLILGLPQIMPFLIFSLTALQEQKIYILFANIGLMLVLLPIFLFMVNFILTDID